MYYIYRKILSVYENMTFGSSDRMDEIFYIAELITFGEVKHPVICPVCRILYTVQFINFIQKRFLFDFLIYIIYYIGPFIGLGKQTH